MRRINNLDIPHTWKINTQVIVADKGRNHTAYSKWKTEVNLKSHSKARLEDHTAYYWNREITTGEIGCTISHLSAINSCCEPK